MHIRKPDWLKIRAATGEAQEVEKLIENMSLNTVCQEANCPNRNECFGRKTATFMILGRVCSRNCTFCNVEKGCPTPVDENEPEAVAQAIQKLGLEFAVITSVTRDDLKDGGAAQFVAVIKAIRKTCPSTGIEVLIPDFKGNPESLKLVVDARPEVINHNIETIPRLYDEVRPMADYRQSLEVLARVKRMDPAILTKSGIMVGLGEAYDEVLSVFEDLRQNQVDLLTIGQYLAPSKAHHPIIEYIHPDIFDKYKAAAYETGFRHVASGPFVRSSYHAEQAFK